MEHADWHSLPHLWLLWLNTAILILSSVGLQWARVAANRGQIGGVKLGLLAGGGFAFAFLAGQIMAWQQLAASGYFTATNAANAYFCLLTALHGVHLLGGLVAWRRTTAKVWGGAEMAQVRLSVELCAVYWHFLLVIWLILFGLLLFYVAKGKEHMASPELTDTGTSPRAAQRREGRRRRLVVGSADV